MSTTAGAGIGGGAPGALGHLRVLDLTMPPAHHFGKVMASLGADVIKVEPPGGDPARQMAPFAGDSPHPEGSLQFAFDNTGKRGIVLDLASASGRRVFRKLAATADIVVEGFAPGHLEGIGLGYRSLSRRNPGLVMTSITPFGQSGPYREYKGSDLIVQAMGGLMYVQGDDERAPCAAPCDHAYQLACFHAAYGVLAALHRRRATGRGQHVDVSAHETTAQLMFTIARYASEGSIVRRTGMDTAFAPNNYYPCKDGYACLCVFFDRHWDVLVKWMDNEALADPAFSDTVFRRANPDIVEQFVGDFVAEFGVQEFVEEGQRRHLAVSRYNTPADVATNPHAESRDYFVSLEHPHLGRHKYPGPPFRMSRTPPRLSRPAPTLGQHQQEVLDSLDRGPQTDGPGQRAQRAAHRGKSRPLEGVRIVDFTRVWAGPLASRYLADLGAEVIKIETEQYLDLGRRTMTREGMFQELHHSKLGITLSFQQPAGRELVERMVEVSDVVLDNFAAGVLERRGLGYDALRRIRPDIIVASMPGYGTSGEYSPYVAYGQNLMSYSGLSYLWGHPESPHPAHAKMHYPDFVTGSAAAAAVLAALEYRNETGKGQFIEVDQSETVLSSVGLSLMDYFVNGRSWEPAGNRSVNVAPRGCYPCRGHDEWCVIECSDQNEWQALCEAMEDPELATDIRFVDIASRVSNRDELDQRIAEWTRERTPLQVTRLLQKMGVPAGAVNSGEQLYSDVHLRARDFIVRINHTGGTSSENTGIPVRLSASPGTIPRGLPALGEHNNYTFGDLLGLSPQEMEELIEARVIA